MDPIVIILSVVTVVLALTTISKDITIQRLNKQYNEERKDLLNRIMARDITEYKNVNNVSLPKGNNPLKDKVNNDFRGLYEE